eukprot:TRINITY_DN1095_c0_g1_i1.p1 TRINITY_DN1095_c0_g1~~TRINITY_DN1095_c0_g1_i1.p1  ORF type:complete len:464 (+),score=124.14 TRINITY_DN1095_c0_g1_i1:102-1493(+)
MLDILLFREDKGGNPELVRESQRRRYAPVEAVDGIISLDKAWREKQHQLDNLRRDFGALTTEIGKKKKAKENADDLVAQVPAIKQQIAQVELECEQKKVELDKALVSIGNIVHDTVPVSDNEENNGLIVDWGEKRMNEKNDLFHHHELLWKIDGFEPLKGSDVAGSRCYFLKGPGVQLNLALINYGLSFLMGRKYTPLQTPYFMNKDVMAKTAQLSQFDEELYKVTAGTEEKYLIATSEQPISAFHQNEWLDPKVLPLRYAGYSTCFRKEAGAYGKDAWGIFRVHQFEKVEQFLITAPENSWEALEEMVKTSEEFYRSLNLPYRVVSIVSKELNNAAAKKYDLEGWFPTLQRYRELVSCSNCTDYQSRHLEIRYGVKKAGDREKKYVHMLNGTLCATTRTICAILENYQTPEGIKIPAVLQPFMGGIDFIPFTRPLEKRAFSGAPTGAPATASTSQPEAAKSD